MRLYFTSRFSRWGCQNQRRLLVRSNALRGEDGSRSDATQCGHKGHASTSSPEAGIRGGFWIGFLEHRDGRSARLAGLLLDHPQKLDHDPVVNDAACELQNCVIEITVTLPAFLRTKLVLKPDLKHT